MAVCPDCGTHLNGGWVQRTREVIELPVAPVEVLVARICPVCQRRRLPKEALQGVVLGQQRLGVNLVSLMVTLREEGRLPIRIIQWYLETVHQLHLSVGAIVQAVHGVARQAETAVREVLEQVRASPVVQGDETGWRQDGSNGYVWTFSTPSERYSEAKASVLPRAQPGHRTQLMLEEKLMVLARPFLKDPLAVQAKLCRRMERFIKELFVFVSDPAVPSDNNAAERSLRHLVTSRKISGGTRSGQGTDSKMSFGTRLEAGMPPVGFFQKK